MFSDIANVARSFASHPLTRDAQFSAWTRFVSWQLKSRMQSEVVVPWIADQRLVVRRGMAGATGNIYSGLHEFAEMMLVLHFLRKDDCFLDIGANVGTYTVLASGVARARTLAFEPDAQAASDLRRNVATNGLEQLVTVHELALGPADGDINFTYGRGTENRVATATDSAVQTVRQRRLDSLITDQQPIMIKMDVESYEAEVFAGAAAVLANPNLRIIQMETTPDALKPLLVGHRFQCVRYDPFRRSFENRSFTPGSTDFIFIRDPDFVRARISEASQVRILGHSI